MHCFLFFLDTILLFVCLVYNVHVHVYACVTMYMYNNTYVSMYTCVCVCVCVCVCECVYVFAMHGTHMTKLKVLIACHYTCISVLWLLLVSCHQGLKGCFIIQCCLHSVLRLIMELSLFQRLICTQEYMYYWDLRNCPD